MTAPLISPSCRIRRTPFSDRVEAAGVKGYTVYNHMLLATAFRSVEEDYWHLREHVQIWDVGVERQVELAGPDAARLAQLMTPRDLSRATVGRCVYAPVIDETAAMLNDPVILKLADDRFWLSIADSDVLLYAKGLALGFGLDVAIDEPAVWPLAVQGPKSDDLMAAVFGEAVRDIRFFRFAELPFRGHPLIVARSGWSKQGGFEIYVDDAALGGELWDALWTAGALFKVGPGCPNIIERVEGGLLSYGSDMTRAHNPLECGLNRYCDASDAIDHIGRDAVRRIRETGVRRQIRGVAFDGPPCPPCVSPWPVRAEGAHAGRISSAVWSPRLDRNVAFAMMEGDFWDAGHPVTVHCPDGVTHTGRVADLPFD